MDYFGALFLIIFIVVTVIILFFRSNKQETLGQIRERKAQEEELQQRQQAQQEKEQRRQQAQQEKVQQQIDNQVDTQVKRLYAQYGEEWINNAGRSRLAMAIDEMLGPAPRRDSNAARAQRTLAAAVLETVLASKMEKVRQQQAASREDSQAEIAVDPMLAVDIVDTAQALAADTDYTNDLENADDVDDFDDIDDVDDVDMDIDLDLD